MGVFVLILAAAGGARPAWGQQVLSQAGQTIQVESGKQALLTVNRDIARISEPNQQVARTTTVSLREIIVEGLSVGTTSLLVWGSTGPPQLFTIEVVADVTGLQNQLQTLFPQSNLQVQAIGNSVIVTGSVRDPAISRRAIALAQASGATVINNIQAPSAEQILLHVRFAEVRRSALKRLGAQLAFRNIADVDRVVGNGAVGDLETLSEGIVNLLLSGNNASLDASIQALRSTGEFRSLAEPNLIALEGQEATFLAGGEFPYPTLQGGGQQGSVTIAFKEFGVRLSFTPTVTNSGTIRLKVAPEVSSLDFANGLTISGFQIPALVTRRTTTEVELAPGQNLAIAGLLDNSLADNVDKIPFLGDLPIIGALFRSKFNDQNRTELLVLVTPHIVEPSTDQTPIPTGEPGTWKWDRSMQFDPNSVNRTMPQRRRGN